jgi:hypothetical protein
MSMVTRAHTPRQVGKPPRIPVDDKNVPPAGEARVAEIRQSYKAIGTKDYKRGIAAWFEEVCDACQGLICPEHLAGVIICQ